jgi:hypothetical protein
VKQNKLVAFYFKPTKLHLIARSKWDCDGSGGYNPFKQKQHEMKDNSTYDEQSLFICIVYSTMQKKNDLGK